MWNVAARLDSKKGNNSISTAVIVVVVVVVVKVAIVAVVVVVVVVAEVVVVVVAVAVAVVAEWIYPNNLVDAAALSIRQALLPTQEA